MKLTCIISGQSIAAIMYDGSWAYFDIDKKVFSGRFCVEFANKKTGQNSPAF